MTVTDLTTYWDRYAGNLPTPPREEALKKALRWCQYDDHGHGPELMGEPESALELGCGRGDSVAALASPGVEATGVDLSAEHVRAAHQWWGSGRPVRPGRRDRALVRDRPAVGRALVHRPRNMVAPGPRQDQTRGRFVFARAPAITGAYGVQRMHANGFRGRAVWVHRWAYEPQEWEGLLRNVGFEHARVWVEPAPEADHVGTLIGVACTPR